MTQLSSRLGVGVAVGGKAVLAPVAAHPPAGVVVVGSGGGSGDGVVVVACVCWRGCGRAGVRACVRAFVRACVRACVHVHPQRLSGVYECLCAAKRLYIYILFCCVQGVALRWVGWKSNAMQDHGLPRHCAPRTNVCT